MGLGHGRCRNEFKGVLEHKFSWDSQFQGSRIGLLLRDSGSFVFELTLTIYRTKRVETTKINELVWLKKGNWKRR